MEESGNEFGDDMNATETQTPASADSRDSGRHGDVHGLQQPATTAGLQSDGDLVLPDVPDTPLLPDVPEDEPNRGGNQTPCPGSSRSWSAIPLTSDRSSAVASKNVPRSTPARKLSDVVIDIDMVLEDEIEAAANSSDEDVNYETATDDVDADEAVQSVEAIAALDRDVEAVAGPAQDHGGQGDHAQEDGQADQDQAQEQHEAQDQVQGPNQVDAADEGQDAQRAHRGRHGRGGHRGRGRATSRRRTRKREWDVSDGSDSSFDDDAPFPSRISPRNKKPFQGYTKF